MNNNKRLEALIYACLWMLALTMMLLDVIRERSYTSLPLLDMQAVCKVMIGIVPFMALFAINNFWLIPRYLKSGRYGIYFLSVVVLVAVIWIWQSFIFIEVAESSGHSVYHGPPHNGPHPLLPLPLFLNVIYDLLIVGVNLAISLMFQHFDDRLEQERLMKENAENRLSYLKAQINPHFYMNMLNNIHGMIEIDPVKAQDMVIDMSGLMRYMLYDSSRPEIELSAEVGFIRNYLALMRERYPEDAVAISLQLPPAEATAGINVPPLLFLVFIENAFKHGISYSGGAFVSVSLTVGGGMIEFCCMNSVNTPDTPGTGHGIGLDNVKKRMDIIYEDRYRLDIEPGQEVYSVNLTLPYETKDADNR
ncbi:MAG: sensor histidine kinase [Muribaculaceae bacterium]|nr:sensor histidine kinase [Muribaculaceae bacterium]